MPLGFRSTVSGRGKAGDWRIYLDEVPPLLAPLSAPATVLTKKPVLAQLAQDPTDDHYPLLVFDEESFGDFKFSTRFKIVSGTNEQMAGVAFRIQDDRNYYYVRASALGGTFYFFKVINGELIGPVGSKVPISPGSWHELGVECKGSYITCSLDGKALIPGMRQDHFAKGKIGFWTKSDSVSYFSDAKIVYTPLEVPAQALVRQVLAKYPRLLGVKIYVLDYDHNSTHVVASNNDADIGQSGDHVELDVIRRGVKYYGKGKESVVVTLPLRDRNGEIMAAVRVSMKTFTGQTEANAITRAMPIVQEMQAKVRSLQDLLE